MGISLFRILIGTRWKDAIVEFVYHLQIFSTVPMKQSRWGSLEVAEGEQEERSDRRSRLMIIWFDLRRAFTSLESIGNAYDFMVLCSTGL